MGDALVIAPHDAVLESICMRMEEAMRGAGSDVAKLKAQAALNAPRWYGSDTAGEPAAVFPDSCVLIEDGSALERLAGRSDSGPGGAVPVRGAEFVIEETERVLAGKLGGAYAAASASGRISACCSSASECERIRTYRRRSSGSPGR